MLAKPLVWLDWPPLLAMFSTSSCGRLEKLPGFWLWAIFAVKFVKFVRVLRGLCELCEFREPCSCLLEG